MIVAKYLAPFTAFAVGIGAAFGSTLMPSDVYVKAAIEEGGAIRCVNVGAQCETSGLGICQVRIPTIRPNTGGTMVACTSCLYKTYKDSDCIDLAFGSGEVQISSVMVYELRKY